MVFCLFDFICPFIYFYMHIFFTYRHSCMETNGFLVQCSPIRYRTKNRTRFDIGHYYIYYHISNGKMIGITSYDHFLMQKSEYKWYSFLVGRGLVCWFFWDEEMQGWQSVLGGCSSQSLCHCLVQCRAAWDQPVVFRGPIAAFANLGSFVNCCSPPVMNRVFVLDF